MSIIIDGTNGISDLDGSASTPAIRGTDANTGIFFPAADTIGLATGGSERVRIDSSGSVLVGTTTSPSTSTIKQVVADTVSAYYQFTRTSSSVGGGAIGTDGSSILIYTHTGNVGSETYTERARITSGGYFKASNNGTYYASTGLTHEFYQTAEGVNCFLYSSNASLASAIVAPIATRTANSAYSFFRGFSDSGNDTEFLLRGDGNGYADGTWNNNGADYAEFFESANGQALTLGATVVLDGTKVREATDQDPASAIIGVVRPKEPSKASMVVGNTAWNKWANKYLTDDFDRYIMEDHDVVEWEETITDEEGKASTKQHSYESHNIPAGVTVPADAVRKTHDDKGNKFQHYKLNPAWDKDAEYVNRENRPEWNIIGLLGQVKILKGQPVGDRWIKMRDVSETVEEWMVR